MNRALKRIMMIGLFAAAALTAVIYVDDTRRAREFESERAGQLLRQLAAQVEGLMLHARERGEPDPVNYAIRFFGEGPEPRAFRMTKLRDSAGADNGAAFKRAEDGSYEFVRTLDRGEGTGVRIRFQPASSGFLGARSALANDLRAAALFTFLFLLIALAAKTRIDRLEIEAAARLRADAQRWTGDALELLKQITPKIRETLETASELAASSLSSERAIGELKNRIHAGLSGAHQSRRALGEQEVVSAQMELAALKIEKALRSGELELSLRLAREMQGHMQNHRRLAQVAMGSIKGLELELEPWSHQVDDAALGLESIIDLNERLRGSVRETTDKLKGQAQFLRDVAESTK